MKSKGVNVLLGSAVCYDDEEIWISAMEYNGLYCYDLKSGITRFIDLFPNEEINTWKIHCAALKYENNIIFIPDRTRRLHIYNKETDNFEQYEMDVSGRGGCICFKVIKNKVYYVNLGKDAVLVEFSLQTKQFNYYLLDNDISCKDIFISYSIEKEGIIYLARKDCDKIICFDVDNGNCSVIEINGEGKGFGTIYYENEEIWLSSARYLYKYNLKNGYVRKIDFGNISLIVRDDEGKKVKYMKFTDEFLPFEKPFSFSISRGDYLLLFPFRTDSIIRVDKINMQFEKIELIKGEKEDEITMFNKSRLTYCHFLYNGSNTFSSSAKRFYYRMDDENVIKYVFIPDESRRKSLYKKHQMEIDMESEEDTLIDFIYDIISV